MERTRGKEAGRGPPGQGQRRARGPARRWPKARSHPGTLALCKGEKAAAGRKHPRDWDAPRGATPWGRGRGARVGGVRPGRALPSDLRSALGHRTGFAATTATTLSGTTLAVASPRWHPHGGTPGGDTHTMAPPEVAPNPPRRCWGCGWCRGGSRAHPARPPSPAMPESHGEAASPPSCPPSVTSSGAGERGNFPSALSTVF